MGDIVERGRRLVVRVGRNSLAFSAVGEGSEVIYEPYPLNSGISVAANMREALQTVALLGRSYGSVLVMVDTPVAMVPVEEYQEPTAGVFYHHAFTGQEHQQVVSAVLPDLHCVALFAVSKDLQTVIGDHWRQVRYVPCMMPVWHHLHQRSYTGVRAKLYACFHERQMDVFAFGKNRFRYCNAFAAGHAADALFYLLSVWKQLGMEAGRDELYLVGELPADGSLQARAEEFVKRVYVINPVGEFNRAPVAQIAGVPYDIVTLYLKGL